jgi:hypothetical protein
MARGILCHFLTSEIPSFGFFNATGFVLREQERAADYPKTAFTP